MAAITRYKRINTDSHDSLMLQHTGAVKGDLLSITRLLHGQ